MTERAPRLARRVGAVLLGFALASLPFVQFGTGYGHGQAGGPHSDHAPRIGGVLQMVGDHHVEVVADDGRLRAYVSDAWRRPLRPASAVAHFDSEPRAMTWRTDHFAAPLAGEFRLLIVEIALRSGETLRVALDPALLRAP